VTHFLKSIGCWIDGPAPSNDGITRWAQAIADAGITHASIWLPRPGEPWLSRWSPDKLAKATLALGRLGVHVSWTIWPAATPAKVKALLASMAKLVNALVAAGGTVDFVCPNIDAEGPTNGHGWGPGGVELAPVLVDGLMDLGFQGASVTAVPFKGGLRAQDRALIEHPDVTVGQPQCYSQYQDKKAWTHQSFFRPGVIQPHGWRQWSPFVETGDLGWVSCGIMTSFQNHPKPHPTGLDAVKVSVGAALDAGFESVFIWSWKHYKGQPHVQTYLKGLLDAGNDTGADIKPTVAVSGLDLVDAILLAKEGQSVARPGRTPITADDMKAKDWRIA
jgi:hypothetical protein